MRGYECSYARKNPIPNRGRRKVEVGLKLGGSPITGFFGCSVNKCPFTFDLRYYELEISVRLFESTRCLLARRRQLLSDWKGLFCCSRGAWLYDDKIVSCNSELAMSTSDKRIFVATSQRHQQSCMKRSRPDFRVPASKTERALPHGISHIQNILPDSNQQGRGHVPYFRDASLGICLKRKAKEKELNFNRLVPLDFNSRATRTSKRNLNEEGQHGKSRSDGVPTRTG